MQIQLYSAEQLTGRHIATWSRIQETNPFLDSPYFRPEFTQAVAATRGGVEVAVLENAGRTVGFFPFQRVGRRDGRPVGDPLSDFQAVVCNQDLVCDPRELLAASQLSSWRFDHLLDVQPAFRSYAWHRAESPHVDLSAGFSDYATRLKHRDKYLVGMQRRLRRLERERGPVRFEAHAPDEAVLSTLLEWKGQQYRRTKARNVFDALWARRILHHLLRFGGKEFAPMVSVLYVRERIAAIHYGLRSREVLHSWFPTYDRELARFSPGILLFLEIFKAADALGIRRVDFAKGFGVHKHRYMSGAGFVLEGALDARAHVALARRLHGQAWQWLRDSVAYEPLRHAARAFVGLFGGREFS